MPCFCLMIAAQNNNTWVNSTAKQASPPSKKKQKKMKATEMRQMKEDEVIGRGGRLKNKWREKQSFHCES